MKPIEADMIISEYMQGWHTVPCDDGEKAVPYTESLDTLVPVWEKIISTETFSGPTMGFNYNGFYCQFVKYSTRNIICEVSKDKFAAEVASIATAKAIKELSNE